VFAFPPSAFFIITCSATSAAPLSLTASRYWLGTRWAVVQVDSTDAAYLLCPNNNVLGLRRWSGLGLGLETNMRHETEAETKLLDTSDILLLKKILFYLLFSYDTIILISVYFQFLKY